MSQVSTRASQPIRRSSAAPSGASSTASSSRSSSRSPSKSSTTPTSRASSSTRSTASAGAVSARPDAATVRSARLRFARGAGAPSSAQPKPAGTAAPRKTDAASKGAQEIARAATRLPADGKEARRADVLRATRAVKSAVRDEPPAVQREILKRSRANLQRITRSVGNLGPEDTRTALGDLSQAAESVGQNNVKHLTDPMAAALPDALRGHGSNAREITQALSHNIEHGKGALLGAGLAVSLQNNRAAGGRPVAGGVPGFTVRGAVHAAVSRGLASARERFEARADKLDEVKASVGRALASVDGFGLTDEELNAGVKAVRAHHKEDLDAYDDTAGDYAATLDGAAYLRRELRGTVTGPGSVATRSGGGLRGESRRAIENLPRMRDSERALTRIAASVEREADGHESFLGAVEDVGGRVDDGRKWVDAAADTVVKSGAARAAHAASRGDLVPAQRLLEGLKNHSGVFGVSKSDLGELQGLFEQRTAGAISEAELQRALPEKLGSLGATAGRSPSGRASGALKLFTVAVGAASILKDPGQLTKIDEVEGVRSLVDAADLGADATDGVFKLLGRSAPGVLSKGSTVLAGVSAAFDLYDATQAWQRGDKTEAALSAASAAGGLVLTGAALAGGLGPVGLVGIGVIGGVTAARYFIGKRRQKNAERRAEEEFGRFLEGAGVPSGAAAKLRDLDAEHRSAWDALRGAAPELGVTPRALLDHLVGLDPARLQSVVDAAEGLPRDDDGVPRQQGLSAGPFAELQPASVEDLARWLRRRGLAPAA